MEMSSELDICKLFPAMTLEDKSSSSSTSTSLGKLKKKKKKKKEEKLKKVCCGGVKKKKTKKSKKKSSEDVKSNEEKRTTPLGVSRHGPPLGVKRSGTTYSAAIKYPDGRLVKLGTYMTMRHAAMAYDMESLKIYGLQKPFNFPHRVNLASPRFTDGGTNNN